MATATKELRDIRDELNELRAAIGRGEISNGHHIPTADEMRLMAKSAGASLRSVWDRGRASASDAYASYETTVARRPLTATAVALGLGVVLGGLLGRRRY